MRLKSHWIEPVEYEASDVIRFPDGLPGFPEKREFIIVPADTEDVFVYLHSVTDPEVCLLLTNPFLFFSEYKVELPPDEVARLGNPSGPEQLATFAVVNAAESFSDSTANLMAPIFINPANKIGLQFIPQITEYNTRHPLFSVPAGTKGK
jgi:flagellar assembly factor FliW